jgi:hypothetical protein
MKEKFFKVLLLLPVVLLAQAPPDDEPTVPIDNYTIPVLLLIVLISYLVFKANTNTLTNKK